MKTRGQAHGRRHDPISIPAEIGFRRVHRIKCSECPVFQDISANTNNGSRAHDDLLKIWDRGGWHVGRQASQDLCSACQTKHRLARKQPAQPKETAPMNASPTSIADIARRVASATTEPREMSFEDRRIILSKLQETYVDEKVGYGPGWTDQRIGQDLGIPWAWVSALREANFGPVRDNEEIRQFVEEGRAALADYDAAISTLNDLISKAVAKRPELAEKRAEFAHRFAAIEKQLGMPAYAPKGIPVPKVAAAR